MKPMKVLPETEGKISSQMMRDVSIQNLKEIMSRNKQISVDDIMQVGIIEDGSIQFKVPKSIRDRQIIILIAYTMWFYNIKPEELK